MTRLLAGPSSAAVFFFFATLPVAAQVYRSDLVRSNSPVVGGADLTFQLTGNQLTLSLHLTGVEPGMPHPIDLHGFADGSPSQLPTIVADPDRDSIMETFESAPYLGPAIFDLGTPIATATGIIDYTQTFIIDPAILGDLSKRSIEIHGRTVAAGIGAGTFGEVNGLAGYKSQLPIASGLIGFVGALPTTATTIPLPNAAIIGVSTMAGLALAGATKRKRDPRRTRNPV